MSPRAKQTVGRSALWQCPRCGARFTTRNQWHACGSSGRQRRVKKGAAKANKKSAINRPVRLLAGGNPQIAKADGDAPVQAYIAAMPSWKRDVGRRLDALIVRTVPNVRKAVKWNSPFYGIEGQGWFVSFHVFARYIKVVFFKGTSLEPVPPGGTSKEGRWIDIHEGDDPESDQLEAWIEQASKVPGWVP